jgi:beta-lactam-binding protein with PASTA domain
VQTEQQETEDSEPGTVLSQDPAGGTEVDRGSSVTITVAQAPPDVEVPDQVGQDVDTARAALDDAGFEVRVREQDTSNEEEDGVVIDQNPPGGEERPAGTRVTLVVGRFAEATPTPTPSPTPTATVEPG